MGVRMGCEDSAGGMSENQRMECGRFWSISHNVDTITPSLRQGGWPFVPLYQLVVAIGF